MCSSLRFRFTISLPPTSPGWRWTKMTRWVLYYSLLSELQELLVFSAFIGDPTVQVVHVSHNVTAFEFFYEPFYVSLDSAPLYDERFEGYGFTRNTQVENNDFWRLGENLEPFQAYELHLAGWNFQVKKNFNSIPDLNLLNLLIILPWKYVPTIKCFSSKVLSPVFTVHWGLAKKKGRPTWRERFFFKCVFLIDFFSPRQNSNNRKRFPHFKKELYARSSPAFSNKDI